MRSLRWSIRAGLLLASGLLALVVPAPAAVVRVAAVSPVDGARYVRPETSILLRFGEAAATGVNPRPDWLAVAGSRSGAHAGTLRLTRDREALVFQPRRAFAYDETVTVHLAADAALAAGALGESRTLTFTTGAPPPADPPMAGAPEWQESLPSRSPLPVAPLPPAGVLAVTDLPGDFPLPSLTPYGESAPGRLYAATWNYPDGNSPYLMILENDGTPAWFRARESSVADFKRNADGTFTYFDITNNTFVVLDSTMTAVDEWACGNGYRADEHDLRLLPNGHALLMAYDNQVVDMSQVVAGGRTNATVTGLVLQELDQDKQVVFQWRSWDHFRITDCIGQVLTRFYVDYVHGNALELDADGNILLSSRHLNEITKIDRVTGELLWRWGGINNQFTFVGDTLQFTFQHAIRLLPNGHYTLLDNGNLHKPRPFTRACEYALDPVNRTATLVWSYGDTTTTYSSAMGYVQRLENGNTLIGYGGAKPDAIEVAPDGTPLLELRLPAGYTSYRVYRFPEPVQPTAVAPPPGAGLALSGPNPVRGGAVLQAQLPHAGRASLAVLDVQGRVIAEPLPAAWRAAGTLAVPVALADRPCGVYFARLQLDGRQVVRRLVLVR